MLNQILFLTGSLSAVGFMFTCGRCLEISKIIAFYEKLERIEKGADELILNSSSKFPDSFVFQIVQTKRSLQKKRSCPVESEAKYKIYKKSIVYDWLTKFLFWFSIGLAITLIIRCL